MSISIDNYTGSMMDVYNNYSSSSDTTSTDLENKLSGGLTNPTSDELMDVCKEFESYFTEQVFKAMQKMVPESETTDTSTKSTMDYAKEMLMQNYAENSTQNNGLGLAQTLYEQMKRNYNITE